MGKTMNDPVFGEVCKNWQAGCAPCPVCNQTASTVSDLLLFDKGAMTVQPVHSGCAMGYRGGLEVFNPRLQGWLPDNPHGGIWRLPKATEEEQGAVPAPASPPLDEALKHIGLSLKEFCNFSLVSVGLLEAARRGESDIPHRALDTLRRSYGVDTKRLREAQTAWITSR